MSEDDDREDERGELHAMLEVVEKYHDLGLFLPTRTVYVGSEKVDDAGDESGVDARMVERFLKNLHALEHLSSEAPIDVVMNNPGGDVYSGLAMYDAIMESPCGIRITVRGHAMSMGSIVLQAADERVMGPNAVMMVHYGTFAGTGHAKTMLKWMREEERINAWMEQVYLNRITQKAPYYSLEELQAMLNHDTFLTAQQAVDLGLADRVG